MTSSSIQPLHVLAGPCAVESLEITAIVAAEVKRVCEKLGLPFHVKASYRKANRTRLDSFTGIGDREALDVLGQVKADLGVGIVTDIHLPEEAAMAAEVADVLQIPAFLCR
ncbi:MAG: 3-deoxy-8-phosphooctulonate synthase, partial [Bacteroidota bacterium]|nr:3-deoxy-8-phosphooctulonate synthase [Bacteroidota bacterium]